jgi:hypothetical protein
VIKIVSVIFLELFGNLVERNYGFWTSREVSKLCLRKRGEAKRPMAFNAGHMGP